jgi:hypothetical protein
MLPQHALRSALAADKLTDDHLSLEFLYPAAANKKRLNIFRIATRPRMSVAKDVLDKAFALNKLGRPPTTLVEIESENPLNFF